MFFVMTDRNGLIKLIPKNAVWAEVGVRPFQGRIDPLGFRPITHPPQLP
jgi:hypothetical protein